MAVHEGVLGLNVEADIAAHIGIYGLPLRYDLSQQELLNRLPEDFLNSFGDDCEVALGTIGEVQIDDFRLNELSDEQPIHIDDRLILREYLD